jgi:uncharacterized membrane-anchored protein YitT (DUF2179 family)
MATITKSILRQTTTDASKEQPKLSNYQAAKRARTLRRTFWRNLREFILIALGVLSAGLGLKSFLLPNGFIDGGVTGISLLVNKVTEIPLPFLLIIINTPFILLGLRQIGTRFFFRTIAAIVGLALAVAFINYPVATYDKLLVAVFGGFFLGLGIGLAVRGGAVLDGTEVMAISVSRKSSLTIGDVILLFNILIFSAAAYVLGVEAALYSVLTYLAASKTIDFVIEGIEEYTGVTIISVKHKEISEMIVNQMGRGITVYKGDKGYGRSGVRHEYDIIFTVVTRLEVSALTAEIDRLDPNAFVVMGTIKDTKGGMIKKRPLSH